jgi:acyl-CoA thioesterase
MDNSSGLLALDGRGPGAFAATVGNLASGRAFGGELLALATCAIDAEAGRHHPCGSDHIRFLRGGDPAVAIELTVTRLAGGVEHEVWRVELAQDGRGTIAVVTSTRHRATVLQRERRRWRGPREDGPPSPFAARFGLTMIQFDHLAPERARGALDGLHPMWVRPLRPFPSPHALVAFVSDIGLVLLAPEPGELRGTLPLTTEHVLWRHQPCSLDGWLIVDAWIESRDRGCSVVRGSVRDIDGVLVATMAQRVTLRPLPIG